MIYRIDPGTGSPPPSASPDDGGPAWLDWAEQIPARWWAGITAVLLVATLVVLPVARRRAHRAGQHADPATTGRRRDRALLAAALIPAALFWLAVLAGSFRGLVAFARDTLRWSDGGEYLVPATLDGVAVSFAVLAFRAVRKARNPDRAVRIAWGASLAGAVINFAHETGLSYGSALGGGYLALMSILGMLIFDELLAQFEDGADTIVRKRPRFGLRWITWPTNTFCAAVAWINHPPADGTAATVANAIAHLDTVRAGKRNRANRAETTTPPNRQPADSGRAPTGTDNPARTASRLRRTAIPAGRRTTPTNNRQPAADQHNNVQPLWSPAAVANAAALRDRYGNQLPATDRKIRTDTGWSHVRTVAALRAYHANADRPPTTQPTATTNQPTDREVDDTEERAS